VVGEVIGNYQLIRKLGQGGMGVVYLGQHRLLGRRAAIKVLLPALSARAEVVQRFFNEARAVTSVSDPGIVQVFDFGYHSDGSAFIIMEYLEGELLGHRLARLGRRPALEALRLARQLASSLASAHAQQIIHRDLKPDNIFLVPDAEVAAGERTKILDFGIAKLSDDHPGKLETKTGVLIGTPRYMSPEQCRGLTDIDHRSDIYALGCVLFHLLTGNPPFDGEGPGDIISAHIREPAPTPSSQVPELPPAVDALVMRCLAKSRTERFQSMADVTAAIGQTLQLTGTPAPAPIQHLLPTTKVPIGAPPAGALAAPEPRPAEAAPPSAPPSAPSATTLGASSGQLSLAGGKRRKRWMAALAIAAVATAAIAIALVVPRSSTHPTSALPASSVESAPASKPIAEDPARAQPATAREPGTPELQQDGTPARDPSTARKPDAASDRGDASASASAAQASHGDKTSRASAADASNGNDAVRTSATVATSGNRGQPGKRGDAPADSRRSAAGMPASAKPRPVYKLAPPQTRTPEPTGARRADRPTPPPESAAPAAARCTKAAFAAVYNAAAPSKEGVRAALTNLRACHTAGALSDAEYEQTRDALVARL
jgi:eukaryotic-like serine/threonine-protein kinase